jgi:hypothetical protein
VLIRTHRRKFDHITPILRELEWMTVDQTLVYKDMVQTYKCINDPSPPYLREKFYLRDTIHNYSTRSSKDLEIPKSNTNYGQKTFHYRATKHWNSLPGSIKSLRNIKHFKSEVKKHILNNWTLYLSTIFNRMYIIAYFSLFIRHLSHKPKPYDNKPQTVISHLFMVIRCK